MQGIPTVSRAVINEEINDMGQKSFYLLGKYCVRDVKGRKKVRMKRGTEKRGRMEGSESWKRGRKEERERGRKRGREEGRESWKRGSKEGRKEERERGRKEERERGRKEERKA